MFRTIATLALLLLLAVGCWILYKRVSGEGALGSGTVYVTNPSGTKDGGDSDGSLLGGKSLEEVHPTPSRSDDPGTINTEPAANYNSATPDAAPQAATPALSVTPQPTAPSYGQQPLIQPLQAQRDLEPSPYAQGKAFPASDTFAPNSPNGMAYSGTGKFEVYRQGDLTYRMNTATGENCVLYATMEEWRKPIVYSHGCSSHELRRRPRG